MNDRCKNITPAYNHEADGQKRHPDTVAPDLLSEYHQTLIHIEERLLKLKDAYPAAIMALEGLNPDKQKFVAGRIDHDLRNWVMLVMPFTRFAGAAPDHKERMLEKNPELVKGFGPLMIELVGRENTIIGLQDQYPDYMFPPGFERGFEGIRADFLAITRALQKKIPIPEGNMFDPQEDERPQEGLDLEEGPA